MIINKVHLFEFLNWLFDFFINIFDFFGCKHCSWAACSPRFSVFYGVQDLLALHDLPKIRIKHFLWIVNLPASFGSLQTSSAPSQNVAGDDKTMKTTKQKWKTEKWSGIGFILFCLMLRRQNSNLFFFCIKFITFQEKTWL